MQHAYAKTSWRHVHFCMNIHVFRYSEKAGFLTALGNTESIELIRAGTKEKKKQCFTNVERSSKKVIEKPYENDVVHILIPHHDLKSRC